MHAERVTDTANPVHHVLQGHAVNDAAVFRFGLINIHAQDTHHVAFTDTVIEAINLMPANDRFLPASAKADANPLNRQSGHLFGLFHGLADSNAQCLQINHIAVAHPG